MYKIKKLVIVALAITAFTMTGCSSETAAPAVTETDVPTVTEAPVIAVPTEAMSMPNEGSPTPDEAQSVKLLADLGNVSPALNKPVSVERARAVCEDVLSGKGAPELAVRVNAVFSGATEGPLSEPQIADVLKAINENGFCK